MLSELGLAAAEAAVERADGEPGRGGLPGARVQVAVALRVQVVRARV